MKRKLPNWKIRRIARLQDHGSMLQVEIQDIEIAIEKLRGKKLFRCITCKKKMPISINGYCSSKCVDKALRRTILRETPECRILKFIEKGAKAHYKYAVGVNGFLSIAKLSDLDKFMVSRK